ncbi:hypothetical protein D3C81_1253300 [compost metagenome]
MAALAQRQQLSLLTQADHCFKKIIEIVLINRNILPKMLANIDDLFPLSCGILLHHADLLSDDLHDLNQTLLFLSKFIVHYKHSFF